MAITVVKKEDVPNRHERPCSHSLYRVRSARWIEYVEETAKTIVGQMIRQGSASNGGVFTLAEIVAESEISGNLNILSQIEVGIIPPEEIESLRTQSLEQAIRLAENSYPGMDVTSWQNRNPDGDKWGGAVLCGEDMIMSFSGFDEAENETVSLAVGVRTSELARKWAKRIPEVTGNDAVAKHGLWAAAA